MTSTSETKLSTPGGPAARVATKRMRLLVTGGTGVLGRAFVPLASAVEHQVIAPARGDLDLFDPGAVGAAVRPPMPCCTWRRASSRWRGCGSPTPGARTTGCAPRPRASWSTPRWRVGVTAYVQPTITFVYPADQPATEQTPIGEVPQIMRSALVAERQAGRFAAAGRRGVVLRLGLLDGPGTGHGPVTSLGASLHVADAASAFLAALAIPSGVYNVCRDGERVSNQLFADITGWRPRW